MRNIQLLLLDLDQTAENQLTSSQLSSYYQYRDSILSDTVDSLTGFIWDLTEVDYEED